MMLVTVCFAYSASAKNWMSFVSLKTKLPLKLYASRSGRRLRNAALSNAH